MFYFHFLVTSFTIASPVTPQMSDSIMPLKLKIKYFQSNADFSSSPPPSALSDPAVLSSTVVIVVTTPHTEHTYCLKAVKTLRKLRARNVRWLPMALSFFST